MARLEDRARKLLLDRPPVEVFEDRPGLARGEGPRVTHDHRKAIPEGSVGHARAGLVQHQEVDRRARRRLEAGHEVADLSRRQSDSPGERDGHVDVAAGMGRPTAPRSEYESEGDSQVGLEHGAQTIDHERQSSTAGVDGCAHAGDAQATQARGAGRRRRDTGTMPQMSDSGQDLRALRIIGVALIAAPAVFLAVAIFLRSGSAGPFHERSDATPVTWTSLLAGFAVIATSLLLPPPQGREIGRIRGHFILRLALVESGALGGGVAYLLEGETFALGIAAACLAVMITLLFPTRERVERLTRYGNG